MGERFAGLQTADKAAVIMADVLTMCIMLPFLGLVFIHQGALELRNHAKSEALEGDGGGGEGDHHP